MITALVCAIILLVFVAATLYIMLLAASRDIDHLEDFIVELDDNTGREPGAYVMVGRLRADLVQEADDIRDSRKEEGDE